MPVTQFADACGIPRPTMSQLLSGRNKKVSNELITKLHDAFPDLNVMWLMFGQGDMLATENIAATEAKKPGFSVSLGTQNYDDKAINGSVLNFEADTKYASDNFSNPDIDHETNIVSDFEPYAPYGCRPNSSQDPTLNMYGATPSPRSSAPGRAFRDKGEAATSQATVGSQPPAAVPIDPGKRVVNIIVYYSDNSYQAFIPEPRTTSDAASHSVMAD
ncbi:MAG: hypothetical protein NC342_07430 [Pseudoflavonifractor sp.]|nr:hypothetical protein [Pseudoflavonifractor sp.]